MSDQQRKLLPYEHQLVDTLGITKEEYLDFVAQQHIYKDIKEGTVLDIRNWETVAIVLTVIGILFQVAAVLLAPKPQEQKGRPGTRDEIFSPRFGFNSIQELARYGDPVNLIYTNAVANPDGGVRVATSLLWSAVQSYGNTQFVMLMFLLGAGGIGAIDEKRSAFGQTGLRDLVAQNYWLYFDPGGTNKLKYSDLRSDPYGQRKLRDPSRIGGEARNPYRIRAEIGGSMADGFSHAYSPSSANTFGIYGVIPINVDLLIRNESGDFEEANNLIKINSWPGSGNIINAGDQFELTLKQATTSRLESENIARKEAAELRQSLSSVFDNSGVIKLGSTLLKITNIRASNVIDSDMIVRLECVERGRGSSVGYNDLQAEDINFLRATGQLDEYRQARQKSLALLEEDDRVVVASYYSSKISGGNATYAKYRNLNAKELLERGNIWEEVGSRTGGTKQGDGTYVAFKRTLKKSEIKALRTYIGLKSQQIQSTKRDDYFFLKAIARVEEASYETVSPCHIVDFSIKSKIFKRVSGRAEEYGSKRRQGWSSADNGLKTRASMFILKYRKASESRYNYVPGIFIVRGSADIETYNFIRFNSGSTSIASAENWQFIFEPIFDPVAEVRTHEELLANGTLFYHHLEITSEEGKKEKEDLVQVGLPGRPFIEYSGTKRRAKERFFPPLNITPDGMNEWDLFTNSSDNQVQFSFDSGPEFGIAAVTEQIIDPASNYPKLYKDLSLAGLNMYSGRTVQDLRSFSLFVTQGRRSRLLKTSGRDSAGTSWGQPNYKESEYLSSTANGYANTAPDIFIDTILDNNDGIGQYASIHSVGLEQLAFSKKFCETNGLFMDGLIADPTSWREFWAINAGYSLLELAKVGGKDVLVPAVPYVKKEGAITTSLSIVALFNQGNIFEGSYKEEFVDYGSNSQDIIVTAIYRKPERQGLFSLKGSVDVQLADTLGVENSCTKETIDMSAFVTRREQAILVAKFLCQVRRHSRKSVEFKTFPTDSPVFPGAYVYVESAQNQWDNIYTGVIENGGFLNLPSGSSIANGKYSVLCYNVNGTSTTSLSEIQVTDGQATGLSAYKGCLFVLGNRVTNKRVFKVTEVSMDEEGEVTIRAVEHATDSNGRSRIARGLASKVGGLFLIDGLPE
jgi:hypothetical protein